MPERRAAGLLDTSVVTDLGLLAEEALPRRLAISAVTLAELAAGPAATDDPAGRARRQDRLQRVEATFDPLPFDREAARAHGRVHAAVVSVGRRPRRRLADLQIAATAVAHELPLVTRNPADHPADLVGLEDLVEIVPV